MKKCNYKSQTGAISSFVMLAMLFFLFTIIGVYAITSRRAQTQTESLELAKEKYYSENVTDVYNSKVATENDTIPIYTKEQLWAVGTNAVVEIEGKIYTFSDSVSYELKNDIVLNIGEDFSKFSYDNIFGSNKKISNTDYKIFGYYNEKYYLPVSYNGNSIYEGTAVLSASGNNFSTVNTIITGLTEDYFLFAEYNI